MAEALISGILRNQVAKPGDIFATDILPARLTHIHQKYGVSCSHDNQRAMEEGDIVVLAIKPQTKPEVTEELKSRFRPEQSLLSIVAGAGMESLVQGFGHEAVIRVMPNTPAQIGAGVSVWTATDQVPQEHRRAAQAILKGLGEELYVSDEKYIDMATALSASGPAYIFLIMEALIEGGVRLGLPRDMAKALVLQMVLGSARLAKETDRHPAELKDMVASPGGTTVEGLLRLEQGQVRAHLVEAVASAYEKALKLRT